MDPIRQVIVENVTQSFGRTVALRGVNASFFSGEVTTLEGHNGSGKSTLLGILGTLVRPTLGRVLYGSIDEPSGEVRRQIGWVSHESHCYPDLSPAENLVLAASLYGASGAAAGGGARRFGGGAFGDFPLRLLAWGQ